MRESEERRWRKCGWRGKTKRMGSVGGCSLTKWGWIVSMTVGWWGSLASISEMRSKSTPSQAVHSKSSRWTSAHQPFSLSQAAIIVTSWLNQPLSIQIPENWWLIDIKRWKCNHFAVWWDIVFIAVDNWENNDDMIYWLWWTVPQNHSSTPVFFIMCQLSKIKHCKNHLLLDLLHPPQKSD